MGHTVGGTPAPPISIVVLKTKRNVKKLVTKRYPDGLTLSLLVLNDKLVEKSLTFCWDWECKLIREEKEKRKSVRLA
jgi:hypothetical protein